MPRAKSLILTYIIIATALAACSDKQQGDTPVAQVGSATLTRTQLLSALPAVASPADSAVFADKYIRAWVHRQVLLQKASEYLSTETEDIEQSVNEYRASLIIETYQNKLVEQKFKPQITNDDIQAYYDQMKQSFTLSDPAFKGCFAVIPANSPDQKEFFKTLSNFNEESSLKIEEYLFQHASKYKSSFDTWTSVSEIRPFLPADLLPADFRAALKQPLIKTEKDGNIYILKVTQAIPAGQIAPIDFVRKTITEILVSKRKLQFLDKANADIYEQAANNGSIKYYDNK
ncbi:MAG: hypothetical protein II375_02885 [Bacteroidales bacterium]|nr:hypothetical protein [Bacteroidales bacterium]